ncbi:PEP-CTERM system TPR-repeat protein PrsT [Rheinheimera riviphila]|uniref:PEP-CTERM system TPR-repeat protein PrsT n=1 Tax=Rheinheimera riviphila TaxID=1834037 RepID=A0A437QZQ3_9GAMM|nr:XrtA/PEP-CTERM system TPR-repeat protein PrsT [Rheinheimera riviphila]RVU39998.1 PEP-CTERM system TPR-repeat protein PrsT [Rheinheimera riviphila]
MKTYLLPLVCWLSLQSQPLLANTAANSAASAYEKALQHMQQHALREAELELRNSLQQQPDYLPARLLLGQVLLQSAQWPAAEKELQLALHGGAAADPLVFDLMRALLAQQKTAETTDLLKQYQQFANQPAYLIMQGKTEKANGRFNQANQFLQQALQHPQLATLADEAWFELGELQFKQQSAAASDSLRKVPAASGYFRQAQYLLAQLQQKQQPAAALQIYDQLLKKDPKDVAALLAKAQLLLETGKIDAALQLVLTFREQYPNNPYGQLIHAALVGQQGNSTERDRMIKQVQQQLSGLSNEQKEQQELLMLTAILDFSEGQFAQVIRKLKQYLTLYPANARVHQLLAQSYYFLQSLNEAETQIKLALAMTPDDENLVLIGATILQAANKHEAALQLLAKAYQQAPGDDLLRQSYAQALVRAGQSPLAQQVLANGAASKEPLAELLQLGYLQLEAGRINEASANANKLLELDQSKVEIFQFAGDVSLRSGDAAKASNFFQQALVLDKTFKPALLSLAGIALNQQLWPQAIGYYQQILVAAPNDSLTLQLLADAALKSGDVSGAVTALEQLSADDINLFPARLALLELYFADHQTEKASLLLQQLEQQSDLQPEIYQAKVKLAMLQKNTALARHNTEILFGLWYDNPQKLFTLADLQLRNNEHETAEKSIQRLTELGAGTGVPAAALLSLKTRLSLQQGKFDQAKQQLAQLKKHSGDNAQYQELTAHLLLATAKYPEAIQLLKVLHQQTPDPRYFAMLITAYRAAGDHQALQQLLAEYLQQNPADLAARLELADLMTQQGDLAQAQQLYQQAPDLEKQPILLNNLAFLLLPQQPEAALEYASQAYQLLPQHPQIIDTYGWALTSSGKPEQALGVLRDAEIRSPANLMIQLHLAETLRLLNRPAEAKALLQKVQGKTLSPAEQQLADQINTHLN